MKPHTTRPIPLGLTALIAFFSALAALAVSNGHTAHAHGNETHAALHAGAATVTEKEFALHNGMRVLWEDHVTWTRLAVISLVAGTPDGEATVARLLKNQADIGNAIKPFYGKAAGNALTGELRKHILIAAEQARWRANADDIATFLSKANPQQWKRTDIRAMLNEHLRLTTQEVVARLQGRWAADVAAYDRVHHHALGMADALSSGIVDQFPKRFR